MMNSSLAAAPSSTNAQDPSLLPSLGAHHAADSSPMSVTRATGHDRQVSPAKLLLDNSSVHPGTTLDHLSRASLGSGSINGDLTVHGLLPNAPITEPPHQSYPVPGSMDGVHDALAIAPAASPQGMMPGTPSTPTSIGSIPFSQHSRSSSNQSNKRLNWTEMICYTIAESPSGRLVIQELFEGICLKFPEAREWASGKDWEARVKNRIKSTLSIKSNLFIKVPRPSSASGKGSWWTLSPEAFDACRQGRVSEVVRSNGVSSSNSNTSGAMPIIGARQPTAAAAIGRHYAPPHRSIHVHTTSPTHGSPILKRTPTHTGQNTPISKLDMSGPMSPFDLSTDSPSTELGISQPNVYMSHQRIPSYGVSSPVYRATPPAGSPSCNFSTSTTPGNSQSLLPGMGASMTAGRSISAPAAQPDTTLQEIGGYASPFSSGRRGTDMNSNGILENNGSNPPGQTFIPGAQQRGSQGQGASYMPTTDIGVFSNMSGMNISQSPFFGMGDQMEGVQGIPDVKHGQAGHYEMMPGAQGLGGDTLSLLSPYGNSWDEAISKSLDPSQADTLHALNGASVPSLDVHPRRREADRDESLKSNWAGTLSSGMGSSSASGHSLGAYAGQGEFGSLDSTGSATFLGHKHESQAQCLLGSGNLQASYGRPCALMSTNGPSEYPSGSSHKSA